METACEGEKRMIGGQSDAHRQEDCRMTAGWRMVLNTVVLCLRMGLNGGSRLPSIPPQLLILCLQLRQLRQHWPICYLRRSTTFLALANSASCPWVPSHLPSVNSTARSDGCFSGRRGVSPVHLLNRRNTNAGIRIEMILHGARPCL